MFFFFFIVAVVFVVVARKLLSNVAINGENGPMNRTKVSISVLAIGECHHNNNNKNRKRVLVVELTWYLRLWLLSSSSLLLFLSQLVLFLLHIISLCREYGARSICESTYAQVGGSMPALKQFWNKFHVADLAEPEEARLLFFCKCNIPFGFDI